MNTGTKLDATSVVLIAEGILAQLGDTGVSVRLCELLEMSPDVRAFCESQGIERAIVVHDEQSDGRSIRAIIVAIEPNHGFEVLSLTHPGEGELQLGIDEFDMGPTITSLIDSIVEFVEEVTEDAMA